MVKGPGSCNLYFAVGVILLLHKLLVLGYSPREKEQEEHDQVVPGTSLQPEGIP